MVRFRVGRRRGISAPTPCRRAQVHAAFGKSPRRTRGAVGPVACRAMPCALRNQCGIRAFAVRLVRAKMSLLYKTIFLCEIGRAGGRFIKNSAAAKDSS